MNQNITLNCIINDFENEEELNFSSDFFQYLDQYIEEEEIEVPTYLSNIISDYITSSEIIKVKKIPIVISYN